MTNIYLTIKDSLYKISIHAQTVGRKIADFLLKEVRDCTICKKYLPFKPKPILNFSANSRIVIVGQAPGTKVHESGIPWNDPSGDRLREWLGISKEDFYDVGKFAIVPMGFCYPGKGKSGDLPPRPECAPTWMDKIFAELKKKELVILIGKYAQEYFLKDKREETLTLTVKNWKKYLPDYVVLPHPSPRNNIWLKKNEWFEKKEIPMLRKRVQQVLNT